MNLLLVVLCASLAVLVIGLAAFGIFAATRLWGSDEVTQESIATLVVGLTSVCGAVSVGVVALYGTISSSRMASESALRVEFERIEAAQRERSSQPIWEQVSAIYTGYVRLVAEVRRALIPFACYIAYDDVLDMVRDLGRALDDMAPRVQLLSDELDAFCSDGEVAAVEQVRDAIMYAQIVIETEVVGDPPRLRMDGSNSDYSSSRTLYEAISELTASVKPEKVRELSGFVRSFRPSST